MKLFYHGKDGGPKSTVTGYWLVEIKSLFSVALLRFDNGTRESFHSHAFNCVSWVLKGKLMERFISGARRIHSASFIPIITRRDHFHRVASIGTTWVFTIRGPWSKTWAEYSPKHKTFTRLSQGRVVEEVTILP